MSDSILDAAELDAIQAAIRDSAPQRRSQPVVAEATRLALITSDRDAEAARPVALALMNRWLRNLERTLRAFVPGDWRLDAATADIVDDAAARDELRGVWVRMLRTPHGAPVAVAVRGAVVELAAARRCGDGTVTTDADRTVTALALRLFSTAGHAIVDSLIATWAETGGEVPTPADPAGTDAPGSRDASRDAIDGTVVRASVAISGAVTGGIVVFAAPAAVLPRSRALATVPADGAAVAAALAAVPIDVRVELGHLSLRLSQLRQLRPGATFTLPTFVDSPVPVFCGGVLKAFGKPVVARGVLGVEVQTVVGATRPGGKPR